MTISTVSLTIVSESGAPTNSKKKPFADQATTLEEKNVGTKETTPLQMYPKMISKQVAS